MAGIAKPCIRLAPSDKTGKKALLVARNSEGGVCREDFASISTARGQADALARWTGWPVVDRLG